MRHHSHHDHSSWHDRRACAERASWQSLHFLWHAIGRQHHRRGGGPFGGGPFGGGPGGFGGEGDGFPRGRRFTSDDLQLLLLALLAERPSHGYELIRALDARSNGFYSPSPGMVYPALTYLEEVGHVTVEVEGNQVPGTCRGGGGGWGRCHRHEARGGKHASSPTLAPVARTGPASPGSRRPPPARGRW